MFYRTTAARSVLRAVQSSNGSIARSAASGSVFRAQLTSAARSPVLSNSRIAALSARKPVTTALVRYASTVDNKEVNLQDKKVPAHPERVSEASSVRPILGEQGDQGAEEDIDMMAGMKNDVKVIKDTFSLQGVPKEAMYLGLAGVIPYVATSLNTIYLAWEMNHAATYGTGYLMSGQTAEILLHLLEPVQIGYGAVILSFLGAIHWGLEWAGYGGYQGYRRYAIGVVAPAVAWPTLLLPVEYALISQFLAFTFLYYNDARAAVRGWTPAWYSMYRFVLTFIVGGSIVATLIGRERIMVQFDSPHALTDRISALRASQKAEREYEESEKAKAVEESE